MPGDTRSEDPLDDRAALEELERLQRSIQAYRQRREQAAGAFDQFVGGFHEPPAEARHPEKGAAAAPSPANAAAPAIASGVLSVSPPSPMPPAPSRPPFPDRLPATLPESRAGDLFADRPAASADREIFGETAPSRGRIPLVAGIVLAMVVGFVVTMRLRQAAEPAPAATVKTAPASAAASGQPPSAASQPGSDGTIPQPAGPVSSSPSSQTAVPPSVAAPAAGTLPSPAPAAPTPTPGVTPSPVPAVPPATSGVTPPAAGGPAPPAEIRTVRRAWVRVTVDGKRELERELEADARIPLPAGATYVVRAGDAGAVHLLLKGKDQGPLGADAQVVTRTYPAR